MNWQALTTTLVAGALSLALIISISALKIVGEDVPAEYTDLLFVSFGAAITGAAQTTRRS